MTTQDKDRIECAIRHIKTAVDVDPWAVEIAVEAMEKMLVQPEIVRCKDCKYHSHDAGYGRDWCNRTSGVFRVKPDDFCSRAERRTDGKST